MTRSVVVSNSSPLIALDRIGQLSLLPALFGTIIVPPAVRQEVFGSGPLPGWLEERRVAQLLAPRMVTSYLGPGEREAIALAVEVDAAEVLLDDLPARRLAGALGMPVLGTLGLLLRAKTQGLVSEVRPLLQMLQEHDFRMSEQIFDSMVAAAGEKVAPASD